MKSSQNEKSTWGIVLNSTFMLSLMAVMLPLSLFGNAVEAATLITSAFITAILGKGDAPVIVDKKLTCVILPFILCSVAVIFKVLTASTQGFGILLMMPITIACARVLWKKGIITVIPNPNRNKK